MLTSTKKNLSYDEAKVNSQKAKKDIKLVCFYIFLSLFIAHEVEIGFCYTGFCKKN